MSGGNGKRGERGGHGHGERPTLSYRVCRRSAPECEETAQSTEEELSQAAFAEVLSNSGGGAVCNISGNAINNAQTNAENLMTATIGNDLKTQHSAKETARKSATTSQPRRFYCLRVIMRTESRAVIASVCRSMPRTLFFDWKMTTPKRADVFASTLRRANVIFYNAVILSGQKTVSQKAGNLNHRERIARQHLFVANSTTHNR